MIDGEKVYKCTNCNQETVTYLKDVFSWCCSACGEHDRKRNQIESAKAREKANGDQSVGVGLFQQSRGSR